MTVSTAANYEHDLGSQVDIGPLGSTTEWVGRCRIHSRVWPGPLRRRLRFHDLRHAHASLLLQQGVHPKIVSERLGHSGVNITLDTYSHVLPSLQAEAAARLDDLLANG